ncbi:MAG: tyrosine--tRNA ligase, partial [Candidatus Yanofskybacteria bacterium]|nr:tyrosine--tRNA ligase [Candidatus Yanofskybacteria bacterium]
AGMILDLKKAKIRYNAAWLSKLTMKDVLKLASSMTVSRMLERDMFQKRIKEGNEIWLHEFLYPLMQGYDSVAMDVDLEVGGEDQLFNMLVGRKLQKVYHHKEKYVLTTPLLLGTDGRKMSKSYGNTINLLDEAKDMYGKVMALKDDLILHYADLALDALPKEQTRVRLALEGGANPRDVKAELARGIVALYHGEKKAEEAEEEFNRVFREKLMPANLPQIQVQKKNITLVDLLMRAKLASSRSEASRLILQRGVKIDGVVQDQEKEISPKKGMVVQVGKRKFAQIA